MVSAAADRGSNRGHPPANGSLQSGSGASDPTNPYADYGGSDLYDFVRRRGVVKPKDTLHREATGNQRMALI
jgi:hypothetical protein